MTDAEKAKEFATCLLADVKEVSSTALQLHSVPRQTELHQSLNEAAKKLESHYQEIMSMLRNRSNTDGQVPPGMADVMAKAQTEIDSVTPDVQLAKSFVTKLDKPSKRKRAQ